MGICDSYQCQLDSNGYRDIKKYLLWLYLWYYSNDFQGKFCRSFCYVCFGRFYFYILLVVMFFFCRNDLVYIDICLVLLCFDYLDSNILQYIGLWELNFLYQCSSWWGYSFYNFQGWCFLRYLRIFLQGKELGFQFQLDSNVLLDS